MIHPFSFSRGGHARRALAAVSILALVLVPHATYAFRVQGTEAGVQNASNFLLLPNHRPPFAHWDLREFPNCRVPYSLGTPTVDLPADTAFREIDEAALSWNATSPSSLWLVRVPLPPGAGCPGVLDGSNVLGWDGPACPTTGDDSWLAANMACGVGVAPNQSIIGPGPDGWLTTAPNNCPGGGDDAFVAGAALIHAGADSTIDTEPNTLPAGLLALTIVFSETASGRIIEADILFNDAADWRRVPHGQPLNGFADVQMIALHELGHWIGLHHPVLAGSMNPAGPIMYPSADPNSTSNQRLSPDDQDGMRFLYSPDLGDAPDPDTLGLFPSYVRHDPGRTLNGQQLAMLATGAEHIFGIKTRQPVRNYTYEWLGMPGGSDDVDAECEARVVDHDGFDDGVIIVPNPVVRFGALHTINYVRTARDATGLAHDYAAHQVYLNEWLDQNQDYVWDPGEKFVHATLAPTPDAGPNNTRTTIVPGSTVVYAPPSSEPYWLRARLDWGEDLGAASRIDGSLDQTKGAAQLGEVEDYPIWVVNPVRRQIPRVPGTSSALGIAMVYRGDVTAGTTWSALVDANDCVQQLLPGSAFTTFVPSSNQTVVEYYAPAPGPGQFIHTGREQPDANAGTLVRSYVMPPSGTPGREHLIPTTNDVAYPVETESGPATRVLIGAVNVQSGGAIAGSPFMNVWMDSIDVQVTARISDVPIPLERLSLCDPMVQGLAATPAGGGTIHPGRPLELDLAPLAAGQSLVLEVRSSWSVNENENVELLAFPAAGAATTAAPEPAVLASTLQLSSSPNPFRGISTLRFSLPRRAAASLGVYDLRGRLVRELLPARELEAGPHMAVWDGRDRYGNPAPAGVYFYELRAGGERVSRKAVRVL